VDDLIIRVLGGIASPFEEERLRRWREESPDNDATFRELARVWELTAPEGLPEVPRIPDIDAIIARADAQPAHPAASPPASSPARRIPTFRRGWWILAASVAALSLGVQLMRARGPEPVASYQAPGDQTLTVNLRDGSFVRLAAGARLQEWDEASGRQVSLEGRAFFAVAKDSGRPFRVRTLAGQVRVLGTRFELRSEAGSLRAVVVEGRVEVSNEEGTVEVEAGDMALARPGAPPSTTTPADLYGLLDWPQGLLVFQGTPLRQVAQEVTRYFGRPLTVQGETIEDRRITAWFQGESFDEVADALCQAAGAVCRGENGGIAMEASVDSEGGER